MPTEKALPGFGAAKACATWKYAFKIDTPVSRFAIFDLILQMLFSENR
jgi:hypothetical protein